MKNIFFLIIPLALFGTPAIAQFNLGKALDNAKNDVDSLAGKKGGGGSVGLSQQDVINGLKEALKVATNNAGSSASKVDGFNGNSLIKIPFPPDAEKVKKTAIDMGQQKQVDDFVLSLNRAAEQAAIKAAPIFVDAVTSMTIQDGFSILNGADDAATQYMKNKTTQQLHDVFLPIVKDAIQSVNVTKYWTPLINTYNSIPFTQKVNPDLNEYVTQQALNGIFVLMAQEELKIRKQPAARVSDILKKVFGSLDNKQ
jgi:hypothetical protein